jgi:pantoate--beta-alanine ligase
MNRKPRVIRCPEQMHAWAKKARAAGKRIALVPTMGFLHRGHDVLMQQAQTVGDVTVASIFVNPSQFAPHEDLASYPRDLDADLARLTLLGVDAVFAPSVASMYPEGFDHYVTPTALAQTLCGKSRPQHFRGVCTVVAMLLRMTLCHVAVFGRKDYQQWRIVQRMVRDLWLDVEIVGVPTVRDADGLALSSRNSYLSAKQRLAAQILPRTLNDLACAVADGACDSATLLQHARETIAREPQACLEYIAIVDPTSLQPVTQVGLQGLCAAAVVVGKTRLIDNCELRSA